MMKKVLAGACALVLATMLACQAMAAGSDTQRDHEQ